MPLTERVSWGNRQYLVTASLISPHCGRLWVPWKVERGFWGGGHVRICGPTTQVPTSVHFWADAHGCRDREGELERGGEGEGRGGEVDFLHLFSHHSYW